MHDLIIGRKMKFHQQTGKSTRLTQILCVALAIFLTVDKDVDADPDDEVEVTYSSERSGESTSNKQIPSDIYTMELAWQERT
jgi:hypothetical protein